MRLAVILTLWVSLLLGCDSPPPSYRTSVEAFGTQVAFEVRGLPQARAKEAVAAAVEDLKFVEEVTDPGRPGPMARTNQLLSMQGTFSAGPSVLPLIRRAKTLARESDGLFNPAIGHLQALWGFSRGSEPTGFPPEGDRIAEWVQQRPSMADIHIDGIRMRSDNAAVKLVFGEFARGWALQAAAARLAQFMPSAARVRSGDDRIAIGGGVSATLSRPDGQSALQLRSDSPGALYTVRRDRRGFEYQGRHYHPLLDPRTGLPAQGLHAVSVWAADAADAAAGAYALFVAGPQRWRALAARLPLRGAVVVHRDGRHERYGDGISASAP